MLEPIDGRLYYAPVGPGIRALPRSRPIWLTSLAYRLLRPIREVSSLAHDQLEARRIYDRYRDAYLEYTR